MPSPSSKTKKNTRFSRLIRTSSGKIHFEGEKRPKYTSDKKITDDYNDVLEENEEKDKLPKSYDRSKTVEQRQKEFNDEREVLDELTRTKKISKINSMMLTKYANENLGYVPPVKQRRSKSATRGGRKMKSRRTKKVNRK
jgi:hypothetical protein